MCKHEFDTVGKEKRQSYFAFDSDFWIYWGHIDRTLCNTIYSK